MKQIDVKKASELVREASAFSSKALQNLQTERLHELVCHARAHSTYLKEKYKNLPENFTLSDIPVSTRSEMVANFEQWVCDSRLTQENLEKYLRVRENIFKPYLGKYTIATTAGTTAEPLRIVRDARHFAIHRALINERYFHGSLLKDTPGINDPNMKVCAIIPNTGFHSSYLSFLRMQKVYEERGMLDRSLLVPVVTPLPEMLNMLNDFQPDMIGCYPSTILLLAYEQEAGRLAIHPRFISCSAEKLTVEHWQFISRAFGCPVNNNYCSTEGGEAAMLCSHGNLHVNSDWIIIEPVDEQNRPVPDGVKSDGILITNLANLVQPVIRYHMTDNVTMHSAPCGCGLVFPYMEIDGRIEDILEFENAASKIRIAGTTIFLTAWDIEGCEMVQLIQRSPKDLEVRLAVLNGYKRDAIKTKIRKAIEHLFKESGVSYVELSMSEEPILRTSGGKIRFAYQDFTAL